VGCALRTADPIDPKLYDSGTAYSYQPLNPTTVWVRDPTKEEIAQGYQDGDETSLEFKQALLRDLDTETVRVALTTLSGNVNVGLGVVGTSVEGESYALIVDYIKYITSRKKIEGLQYSSQDHKGNQQTKTFQGTVPMYTGIGLRIRAEFVAHQSGLDLSGLPAIAVAANARGISGRLTVQTLGISGSEVTALMPIISDISVTSLQNAVQSVGAIKAKIYEDSTVVSPKIVGFESPQTDPALIRAITGHMYASEEWICPMLIPHPQDPERTIFFIDWFSSGEPESASEETRARVEDA
jgi:hypothetical protein